MKFLFNIILIFGGIAGAVLAFLSRIIVESRYDAINGINLSVVLGVFGIVACIQGFINLVISE